MHFGFISPRSAQYGSWGMLETMNQDLSLIAAPKYQAILDHIDCYSSDGSPDIELTAECITINPFPGHTDLFSIHGSTSSYSIHILDSTGIIHQDLSHLMQIN